MRAGLILDPLDVLFFRDGRPFEAGTHARSALPWPQTFAGALRTWLLTQAGCDFERLGRAVRSGRNFSAALEEGQAPGVAAIGGVRTTGPWLALVPESGGGPPEPLVPVPASLRAEGDGGDLVRRDPLERPPPGWSPEFDGELPVWPRTRKRTEAAHGWLRAAGLATFLGGGIPARSDLLTAADLFDHDYRTGIAVDPRSSSSVSGQIYSIALLALRPFLGTGAERLRVALCAEAEGPEEAVEKIPTAPVPLHLGGEGRRAAMRRVPPLAWPRAEPAAGSFPLLLLASPGIFGGGWRPVGLSCVGAVVPEPVAISGWDLARGSPKPTRFAAPAGSVYFARELPAGFAGSLGDPEDTALGYGTTLVGSWQHV